MDFIQDVIQLSIKPRILSVFNVLNLSLTEFVSTWTVRSTTIYRLLLVTGLKRWTHCKRRYLLRHPKDLSCVNYWSYWMKKTDFTYLFSFTVLSLQMMRLCRFLSRSTTSWRRRLMSTTEQSSWCPDTKRNTPTMLNFCGEWQNAIEWWLKHLLTRESRKRRASKVSAAIQKQS